LLGVFIVLSVLGTKGDYAAEKAIHMVNRKYAKIQQDTLATPEAEFMAVIEGYKSFLKKYPDSRLVPFAHILIGRTFAYKKDFNSARDTFERISQQYAKDRPVVAAQAIIEIAAVYALEEDTVGILKSYERLQRDFSTTEQGLKAPITYARISAKRDPLGALRYFDNAIAHYRFVMQNNPKTVIEFKALNYIASCYMTQHKYVEARDIYTELLLTYAESEYLSAPVASLYLKTINTLSIVEMGDFDKPVAIYEQFMAKYPQHPLNNLLKTMIQGINELKKRQSEKVTPGA